MHPGEWTPDSPAGLFLSHCQPARHSEALAGYSLAPLCPSIGVRAWGCVNFGLFSVIRQLQPRSEHLHLLPNINNNNNKLFYVHRTQEKK